jgi:hypothetical protein
MVMECVAGLAPRFKQAYAVLLAFLVLRDCDWVDPGAIQQTSKQELLCAAQSFGAAIIGVMGTKAFTLAAVVPGTVQALPLDVVPLSKATVLDHPVKFLRGADYLGEAGGGRGPAGAGGREVSGPGEHAGLFHGRGRGQVHGRGRGHALSAEDVGPGRGAGASGGNAGQGQGGDGDGDGDDDADCIDSIETVQAAIDERAADEAKSARMVWVGPVDIGFMQFPGLPEGVGVRLVQHGGTQCGKVGPGVRVTIAVKNRSCSWSVAADQVTVGVDGALEVTNPFYNTHAAWYLDTCMLPHMPRWGKFYLPGRPQSIGVVVQEAGFKARKAGHLQLR